MLTDKRIQNIIIAIATGIVFLFSFAPEHLRYVSIFGAPCVCAVARFFFSKNTTASKIALGTILAGITALFSTQNPDSFFVWVLEIALMLVFPILVLWKQLPTMMAKEDEKQAKEAEKDATLQNKLGENSIKIAYEDALDDINAREASALLPLEQAVQAAEEEVANYRDEIADNEATWAEQLSAALAPFDAEVDIAQEAVSAETKALDDATLYRKTLETKRFTKGTPPETIAAHDDRIERAEKAELAAQAKLNAAKSILEDKQRARTREKAAQNQLISTSRAAVQSELRNKERNHRAAIQALATARAANTVSFAAERRSAKLEFDNASARLASK